MKRSIRVRSRLLTAPAIVVILLALALPGFAAQQSPPTKQQPGGKQDAPAQQQAMNFSDDKLESVAKAYVKIKAVQQEYGPKIQAAQKPEEAKQLQDEANRQMEKAVTDTDGLTISEYTQVVKAAQQDDQLRQRLIQHIQKQPGS